MNVKFGLRFSILLLMLFAVYQVSAQAQKQDEKNISEERAENAKKVDQPTLNVNNNDEIKVDLRLWFAPVPTMGQVDSVEDANVDSTQAPFSTLFKYNTSPGNPDHRCYEITKSISKEYTFLFNFMSQSKFTNGRRMFIR